MGKVSLFNIGGIWERCRYIDAHGIGPAYFLNKRKQTLTPVDGRRWVQTSKGLWFPCVAGGAASRGGWEQGFGQFTKYFDMETADSLQNHQLNSNYTYNSAGDAIGWRVFFPFAKTVSSIFYRINTITGSPGALTFEIRNDNGTQPMRPGSTTLLSTTDTPSATLGWNEITGLNTALFADTIYWLVVGDPAGSVSDHYRVNTFFDGPSSNSKNPGSFSMVITSTDGFSTAPSAGSATQPSFVLYFSDDTAWGNPLVVSTEPTNDADQKGLYIDGWGVDVRLFAVTFGDGTPTTPTDVKIWVSTSGPSGTPFSTSDIQYNIASATVPAGFGWTQPYPVLAANTPHRIVIDFSGGSGGVPDRLNFGTVNGGGESRMAKAMPGAGEWYWTEENGAVWDDDTEAIPRLGLFIDDFTPDGGAAPIQNTRDFPNIPDNRVFPLV
jgi:hypothetical protein